MITTQGRLHIKRYLAGYVPAIAHSIAIGIGGKAENAADTKLEFEIDRTDIILTGYDFVSNKLIFKAPLPEDFAGTVYELALYSVQADAQAGEFGSRLISTFDSATEDWLDAGTSLASTFTSSARVGADSLRHAPAASATKTDVLSNISLSLDGYSGADKFVFAYNVANANTSALSFQFRTDASNYYTFSLGAQTAGYKFTEAAKSSAVATGSPSWANITEMRVVTTSDAGGASQIDFDAVRIEDVDTQNTEYIMVSRELLAVPFQKEAGKIQDIEFSLSVSVT